MHAAIPCSIMRGGTSKGLYFLASDLPSDSSKRDELLLHIMGSPDTRQIDGLGGAHPLTSKVAIVEKSMRANTDVDYLFLQVVVDKAVVSDTQNCGNLLAGVAPFAIEQGLVNAKEKTTDVRIHMLNTAASAVARVQTPNGKVSYKGDAVIDGVPGSAAPITLDFLDIAGANCGALFPTGNAIDEINGYSITCIDNGMPVVILDASEFSLVGDESPNSLEDNTDLKQKIEAIRLIAAKMMNLGDVTNKTIPKMSLVSPAKNGGVINTRTFIPHRVHEAIGVLGSVSVASACVLKGTVAHRYANQNFSDGEFDIVVEHPTGQFTVEMQVSGVTQLSTYKIHRSALLRTARLLMVGSAMA
ncbi:4-oxalomesaconate tautomerase [Pseudoalteromonas sp. SG43-5]|uniref:4-oxalomesaconate tautomerase n=1 Tax=Pseudoalteromonas sp. SG43-5 TaxID=2760968 RepID=UPI001603DD44|nr:4-oxalomesaconate tautomerase [Pseudoalteromonas sp. SG43-5]MBB1456861.1 4-oxalomesaconate tautomerase [Pseudoalteromonas sp. SG43-5]